MNGLADLTRNVGIAFAVPAVAVFFLYVRSLRRACPPSWTLSSARFFSVAVALVLMFVWLMVGFVMFMAYAQVRAEINLGYMKP